ncbi:MAG: hypothetical protein SVY41_00905 [Candidatus Nanohaloarchaea archaeon]|nr:hypothetical protein [Candidatus Nanohaloarchaea archaeon]
MVAVVLAGIGGYAVLGGGSNPTGDITEQELATFAQCISENNATFYGADWCPHCNQQKAMFGDAMEHVDYVECSPNGRDAPRADVCNRKQVSTYPTWIINGERYTGVQRLSDLASATGCQIPQ